MKSNSKLLMVMLAIMLMTACLVSPVSAKPQTESWEIYNDGIGLSAGCIVDTSNLKVSALWINNTSSSDIVFNVYDDNSEVVFSLRSPAESWYIEMPYEFKFKNPTDKKPSAFDDVRYPTHISAMVIEVQ